MAIIHFQPLERFPPVTNLLNYLGVNFQGKIIVISTLDKKISTLKAFTTRNNNVTIKRTNAIIPSSMFRLFSYLNFYVHSFYLLIKTKPDAVLYFETLSSWPALMYKKLKGKRVKLLVHYHEYTSPESYKNNMRLVKWMHTLEAKIYRDWYEWVSHTNEVRLEKFKDDELLKDVNSTVFHVMPNYPSKSWSSHKNEFGSNKKTRLVFVGSLGYDNMYLQETIDWVLSNKNYFSLDLYAYNIDKKARDLLNSISDESVKYFGGCNYEDLPEILKNYDIGLVMYKPFSYNTVHAVSNKVFEYLACGLDIWFSKDMTYTFKFLRETSYPKIVALDFAHLDSFDFKSAISRENLPCALNSFFYENIYPDILSHLSNSENVN